MALPTSEGLTSLDYGHLGDPFCDYAMRDLTVMNLFSLDYGHLGNPFVRNLTPASAAAGMKFVMIVS